MPTSRCILWREGKLKEASELKEMQQGYVTDEEGLYWWTAPHRLPRLTCGAEGVIRLRLLRVV